MISENRVAQQTLKKERRQQQSMIQQLRRKSRSLTAQIRKKQQQSDAIDQEIQRLIREAIAASNKKAGKKTKSYFCYDSR